ncbi:hypothetical protein GRJ2_002351200 [Grus japonensis]|uniref:Uncharacterized protein n=1 Tax=Grus japonensis TaxID=30415 RepID=A0ABC9XMC7_GRUJA
MLGVNRNEDYYEAAWILDKCQGHGTLPCAVGTVYENYERAKRPSGNGLRHTCDLHLTAVVLSKFKIRVYFCLKGQWRNDVFNEQGVIVNCSGDICDGLWINGYPAACRNFGRSYGGEGKSLQPMRRTTVEQIITLQPKEDPTPGQVDIS